MDSASVGSDVDSILMDRYPDIAFRLHFAPCEPLNDSIHTENSSEDIQRFLAARDLEDVEIFYLYGLGVGAHYQALKNWLSEKNERLLIIIEEDLSVIAAFLICACAEELLVHPQVHLRYVSSSKELSPLMKECVETFPSERVEIAAIASYAKRKKSTFRRLRMQLYRYTAVCHALMTEAIFSHKLLSNLIQNILKWPGSFFANNLKNQFKGVPAIICGAGPSLAKTFDLLKKVEDRALIIAGGSTISSLSNQGIIPHIGIAMDPNAEEFDRLKAASSFEMPLIYGARLEANVFNTCNGERGYLLSDTGGPCEAHFEKAMNLQGEAIGPELGAEAFSVTTLCIALAVEMGCNPIILNGIDLAYTGMQRYAHGVMSSSKIYLDEVKQMKKASERLIKRKDIYGNPCHTLVKWVMESECIGAYAKQHRTCRFINATAGGLGFPKIPNQPLSEIMEDHFRESQDLKAALHTLFQNNKMTCRQEEIHKEIKEIAESLSRLHGIAEEILKETHRVQANPSLDWPTGKMTILEIDFQEEKAFTALFLALGPSLDRLLNRTQYLSPTLSEEEKRRMKLERQRAKWTQFKEMIEKEKEFFLTYCK